MTFLNLSTLGIDQAYAKALKDGAAHRDIYRSENSLAIMEEMTASDNDDRRIRNDQTNFGLLMIVLLSSYSPRMVHSRL